MNIHTTNFCKAALLAAMSIGLCSCGATTSKSLNPFYEPPAPEALLGDANDHALNETGNKAERARAALEAQSTYDQAALPAPYRPVRRAPVVRLMWVPDHLNKHGDFVQAHYFYVNVKESEWNLRDAFEINETLEKSNGNGSTSNVPFKTGS